MWWEATGGDGGCHPDELNRGGHPDLNRRWGRVSSARVEHPASDLAVSNPSWYSKKFRSGTFIFDLQLSILY